MANLVMPIRNDLAAYTFQIDLEGTIYTFTFRYNERMDRWLMDIADANEETIITGIVVLTEWLLIDRFKDDRLPPGNFLAIDESGEQKYPGREDFGQDVKLFYVESEGAA